MVQNGKFRLDGIQEHGIHVVDLFEFFLDFFWPRIENPKCRIILWLHNFLPFSYECHFLDDLRLLSYQIKFLDLIKRFVIDNRFNFWAKSLVVFFLQSFGSQFLDVVLSLLWRTPCTPLGHPYLSLRGFASALNRGSHVLFVVIFVVLIWVGFKQSFDIQAILDVSDACMLLFGSDWG